MSSDFEIKRFAKTYWIISGVFILASLFIVVLLAANVDSISKLFLGILMAIIVIVTVLIYFLTIKEIKKSYAAIGKVSESISDFMKDKKIPEQGEILEEGEIGVLYSNFDKLVNMFRESEKREKQEKEYLKDVMSDISHQLKTPLASMDVFLDLLINDKVDSEEERKKILNETSNQTRRMEWMVLSMLKLARIEAGAVRFEKTDSNLKLILDEVAGGIRYLTDSRGQKLLIDCPDDIIVNVDAEWLTEAIINVVKNASDYSVKSDASELKDGSEKEDVAENNIEISVEQNKVFTRICVRDHGIGMDEETMMHIFERFYSKSSAVNPNSVGIGLSLSKSIVEGLGGRITVDSVLGEGSTFKIQL